MLPQFPKSNTTGLYSQETIAKIVDDLVSQHDQNRTHALFLIDHDTLDNINMKFGHDVGDAVIEHTEIILPSVFRDTDLVARTFEDEFIVLMKDAPSLDTIECVAGLILQLLRCPCGTPEHMIEATVTVGIALAQPTGPNSFMELYDNACEALRIAKRSKLHRFAIVDSKRSEVKGLFGFDRLISASTPNMRPFLDTIDNGGVLLHAEPGKHLIPRFFSDSFLSLLGGMSREEALSVYGDDITAGIHERDRERVRREIIEAFDNDSPLKTIARLRSANGGHIWVSVSMNWMRDDEGGVDAYSSHFSVDKLMGKYDYSYTIGRFSSVLGDALYLFSVAFKDGKPSSINVYDQNNKRLPEYQGTNLAEVMLDSGLVHPDSEDTFREFCAALEAGERSGGALIVLRDTAENLVKWTRISYVMVYDDKGLPLRASGSIRDLPHAVSTKGKYKRELRLFEALGKELLGVIRADLTSGEVEQVITRKLETVDSTNVTYDSYFNRIIIRHCYEDDVMAVSQIFSRKNILEMVSKGIFQITHEFRRIENGVIRWSNLTAHVIENPSNKHSMLFVYVSDIERRHIELSFASSLTKPDLITGLYSRDSLERIAAAVQHADSIEGGLSAVAVVRVAAPSDLRALLSGEDANAAQTSLGQQLALCLAQECLVAKLGADGFLLFFPRIDSEGWLRQRVEGAITKLRSIYSSDANKPHPIVLACGFVADKLCDLRFNSAIEQAREACRTDITEFGGSVWSFDERVDQYREKDESDEERSIITFDKNEFHRSLLGDEFEVLSECMQVMIMAVDTDEAINSALCNLGDFYKAHRVFTVALLETGMVSGLNEWYEAGSQPIVGQIVGRSIKDYSALLNAYNAEAPVLITRRRLFAVGDSTKSKKPWHFIAYPVIRNGLVSGFMCVENPTLHIKDVALLSEIIPLIISIREKQGTPTVLANSRMRDSLTGLPSKAAFDRDTMTFDPTLFHSVGVLRLGLEKVYQLEGERDLDAEAHAILYAARNLSGLFPFDTVYRSGEMELVCVCTNMSYDAFNARCMRMITIMRMRSRAGFALCDAWSDSATPLSKLFDEAQTSVYGDRSILFPNDSIDEWGVKPSTQRAFDGDIFSIRLQPQVNLATGSVVGSEALARCTTPEGKCITPAEFIPRMEEEGTIANLDYFVLDKAFSTISEWMGEGITPVPVSVNFSRKTITESNFVASVLAICSRYDVPENLIEIEITESIGSFKSVELKNAMEVLHDQGFRFALDDLGSEYSTLSAMSELPFDTVKLDRLLIKRFAEDAMSQSIVEGIAHACDKNGIRCVAEGIEQPVNIKPLISSGCQYGQGYCFARPMTVEQFTEEYLVNPSEGSSLDEAQLKGAAL